MFRENLENLSLFKGIFKIRMDHFLPKVLLKGTVNVILIDSHFRSKHAPFMIKLKIFMFFYLKIYNFVVSLEKLLVDFLLQKQWLGSCQN